MGYDLYFSEPRMAQQDFLAYFENRPHYQVTPEQALYENRDTEVYFNFEYCEPMEGEEPDACAILAVNLFRPHVFGLEAALEAAAFANHFGCTVFDCDEIEVGPFSAEAFLRAWNRGNEAGCAALLRDRDVSQPLWTYPGAGLEGIWKWNADAARLQASIGENRFVPTAFYLDLNGKAVTTTTWFDAIPEIIPEVDYLIIIREELSPRSTQSEAMKDVNLVPLADFKPLLASFYSREHSYPCYVLPEPNVPEALVQKVRSLKSSQDSPIRIPLDQVLNAELVDQSLKQ